MFTLSTTDYAWLLRRLGAASFQLQAGPDEAHKGMLTIEQCAREIAAVWREFFRYW